MCVSVRDIRTSNDVDSYQMRYQLSLLPPWSNDHSDHAVGVLLHQSPIHEKHTYTWKHNLHTVPSVSLNSWLSALAERHGWNFPESIIYVAKRFSVLGGKFSNLANSEMSWSKTATLSPPLQAPFWVTSPGHHCNSWLKWKDAINMR